MKQKTLVHPELYLQKRYFSNMKAHTSNPSIWEVIAEGL
jgi:hypothetical protein